MDYPYSSLLQQLAWDRYLRDIEDNQVTSRFNYFLLYLAQIHGRGHQMDVEERNPPETREEMDRRVDEAVEDIFRDFVANDGQPAPEDAHLMPQPYERLVMNAFNLRYFRLVGALRGEWLGWITHLPVMRFMAQFEGENLNRQWAERRAQRAPGEPDEVEPREEMDRRVNEVLDPIFEEIRALEEERMRRREEDRRREQEELRAMELRLFLEDQFNQRFNRGRRSG